MLLKINPGRLAQNLETIHLFLCSSDEDLFYFCSVSQYNFIPKGPYFGNLLLFIVLLHLEQIVHKRTLLFQHFVSVPYLGSQTSSYDLF
jgi:hypothetical protein